MTMSNADVSAGLEEIRRLHSEAEIGRQVLKETVEAMIIDASSMIEAVGALEDGAAASDVGATGGRLLNALMAFDRELHVQNGKSERVEAGLRELIEKLRALMEAPSPLVTATAEPALIKTLPPADDAPVMRAATEPVITDAKTARTGDSLTADPVVTEAKPNVSQAPILPSASTPQQPKITERTIIDLMGKSFIDGRVVDKWRSREYLPAESFRRIPRSVVAETGRIIRMIDMQDPVGRTLFMKMYNFTAQDIEACLAALREVLPTPLPSESPTERQSRHDKAGRLGYELLDVSPDEAYESVLAAVPETVRFALEARKKFTTVNESASVDFEVQKEAKRIFSVLKHFPAKRQEFLRTYFFTERQVRRWSFQLEYPAVKPETLRDVWAENEAAKRVSTLQSTPAEAAQIAPDQITGVNDMTIVTDGDLPTVVPSSGQNLAALEDALGRAIDTFPTTLAADLRIFDLQKLHGPRHRKETYQEYERAGRIMEGLKNHRLLGRWLAHLGLPAATPSLWNAVVEWSHANGPLIDDVERKIAALQIPKAADREGRVDKSLRRPVAEIDILLDQFPHGAKADYYRAIEVNVGTVSGWRKALPRTS